jgi:multidrug efflux pump subunit AcrA (membrane-fusion protein)
VFGKDADKFRPGTVARVTLPDTGETFQARVSDVLPEVDPTTRALKVRLIVNNPAFKLRPDMFVNVDMPVSITAGLSVPADAIVDSGLAKQVFVQKSSGHFEGACQTGLQFDDRQIVKDLRGRNRGRLKDLPGGFRAGCRLSRIRRRVGNAASADSARSHRMN